MVSTSIVQNAYSKHNVDYSTISLHELLKNRDKIRLDAGFYDTESGHCKNLIKNCTLAKKPLFNDNDGFVIKAFYPNRFKRIFANNGVSIYDPSDIISLYPKTTKKISKKYTMNLDELKLQKDTIVMTRSGSVGLCAVVSNTYQEKFFSDDLIRMSLADKSNLGYVYAFLRTTIGKKIIKTNDYGSVIDHLEPEHLMNVMVPVPTTDFRNNINNKITRSTKLRDESNVLLEQANTLLFKFLCIKSIKELEPKYTDNFTGFVVNSKNLNMRLDGSFHVPIINEILSQFDKIRCQLTTLGDERISEKIILPRRFKRIYVKSSFGVPFLGSREILQYDYPDMKYLSLKKHENILNEITLRENMVLITCSGTIGNVILCPKYYDGWSASQHIIRIIPSKKINAGYLYAWLASDYGHELIKRYSYGSVVDEITDDQVAEIPIPLLDTDTTNRIGNFVLDANKKRDQAHRLEKEAICLVEDMILTNQKHPS